MEAKTGASPRIRNYIFPGSYIPSASEVLSAIEPTGLFVTDLEVWRLHSARTPAAWNTRFQKVRKEIKSRMGERFRRLPVELPHAAEANFRWDDLVVFQLPRITARASPAPR